MYLEIKKIIPAIVVALLSLSGCKQAVKNSENLSHSTIPVTVTPVRNGQMVTYMELNATSAFLFKAAIKSPVTGFIDKIQINQGDVVEKNQLLFKIRTKEASALLRDTLNSMKFTGVVDVKAATSGIISSIEHSVGDYVAESDQLCQIAIQGSYAFILDVPFELSGSIKLNTSCEITLPDSQIIKGIIRSRLPSMVNNSQTERFIVRLTGQKNLPENLTGKLSIIKESVKDAASLPKSSLLSNETMQNFWVMKLINDSMAVKVPVTPGITSSEYVQITQPEFKPTDLILTSGNYGLGDTAYVKVMKSSGNEQ
jgi:hypothetical protein